MTKKVIVASSAGVVAAASLGIGSVSLLSTSSSTAVNPPPPPANLEVLSVGETAVTVAWGPTQPGEWYAGAATPSSLVVNWGSSRDDVHGPVTYTVYKNKTLVAKGITRLYVKVGFTKAVRTFRTCVWATNAIGKSGPQMCATWNGTTPAPTV